MRGDNAKCGITNIKHEKRWDKYGTRKLGAGGIQWHLVLKGLIYNRLQCLQIYNFVGIDTPPIGADLRAVEMELIPALQVTVTVLQSLPCLAAFITRGVFIIRFSLEWLYSTT